MAGAQLRKDGTVMSRKIKRRFVNLRSLDANEWMIALRIDRVLDKLSVDGFLGGRKGPCRQGPID